MCKTPSKYLFDLHSNGMLAGSANRNAKISISDFSECKIWGSDNLIDYDNHKATLW